LGYWEKGGPLEREKKRDKKGGSTAEVLVLFKRGKKEYFGGTLNNGWKISHEDCKEKRKKNGDGRRKKEKLPSESTKEGGPTLPPREPDKEKKFGFAEKKVSFMCHRKKKKKKKKKGLSRRQDPPSKGTTSEK